MEIILDLLQQFAPIILTFILGLLIKSPLYKPSLEIIKELLAAMEDGKITKQEFDSIVELIKKVK